MFECVSGSNKNSCDHTSYYNYDSKMKMNECVEWVALHYSLHIPAARSKEKCIVMLMRIINETQVTFKTETQWTRTHSSNTHTHTRLGLRLRAAVLLNNLQRHFEMRLNFLQSTIFFFFSLSWFPRTTYFSDTERWLNMITVWRNYIFFFFLFLLLSFFPLYPYLLCVFASIIFV